jgi:hypothetical protein
MLSSRVVGEEVVVLVGERKEEEERGEVSGTPPRWWS